MYKIEDLHLGNLEKRRPDVFQNYDKSRRFFSFFAQNHFVCDVTIILSVRENHINIFEF